MKSIKTLCLDIYNLFDPKTKITPKDEDLDQLANTIKTKVVEKLSGEWSGGLRMSSIGQPCARKLWYEINQPDKAEAAHPSLYIKFLFGDIIESLVLFLAKTSGHSVTNQQEELVVDGVVGHTDGKLDGVPIDVKSASGYGFKKFLNGIKRSDDAFGYLNQLGLYNYSLGNGSNPAAFVALDKSTGEICVDVHDDLSSVDYHDLIAQRKKIVAHNEPPPRGFSDKEYGASGNRALGVNCSFCPFKKECWPGLRTFAYKRGDEINPVYLTTVVRVPDVQEIT